MCDEMVVSEIVVDCNLILVTLTHHSSLSLILRIGL